MSRKTGSVRIDGLLRDFDRLSRVSSVHASADKTPSQMVADEERLRIMVFQKIMDMDPTQIEKLIEYLEYEQVEDTEYRGTEQSQTALEGLEQQDSQQMLLQ